MKVKDTFEKFIRNTKYHQNSEVWHNGWNIGYEMEEIEPFMNHLDFK